MEQLFTKTLLNKLPTLDHYRQLCHSLSVRNTPYNELNMTLINKVETIEKIQTHMFKIFSYKTSFYNSTILSHIHHISTFKFYISPNTYTNVLTLKQFFHCININYEIGRRRVKRCSYKYNIFYKGDRIDDIRTDTPQPPIERQYISCYGIPIIRPDKIEYDFRELPIEHFEQLLDIMDKDYVEDSSSFIGKKYEYISMYWEDKDVELFLNYIQKSQKYSKYSAENYLDCLEKNIQKNNYTQEKLTPLYEKYLKYETSTKVPYPVKYSVNEFYTGIANILKKYINFPVVRLGFDAAQSITPPQLNKLPSRVKKEETAPMPMGMAEETAPMPMGMAEETKSLERMHSIECASYVETIETLQKKCIELEKKCDAYAMACTALEMANAKLVERTKILDESNF